MKTNLYLSLLMLSILAGGCAHRATIYTPGGTVQVEKKGNHTEKVTIQNKEGSFTVGSNVKVTEQDLGVPIYPGATQGENEGMTSSSEKGNFSMATFQTGDSVDQVTTFYKSKLPPDAKSTILNTSGAQMSMFETETGGKSVSIEINHDQKKNLTTIMIMSGTKH